VLVQLAQFGDFSAHVRRDEDTLIEAAG
jgi:hypothetical protein